MIISLDTETTGCDFVHGAMPYLVTTCDDAGTTRYWQWDVDPLTRRPDVLGDDLADIAALIDAAEAVYTHGGKFDQRALATVGLSVPWAKFRCTIIAGHLLATNHPHNLTDMCVEYLGVDILPLEVAVQRVTKSCRAIVKRDYPHWRVAREGDEDMPSVKDSSDRDEDKPWKSDMWLAQALGMVFHHKCSGLPDGWDTACAAYANADSKYTLLLGVEVERQLREHGLWAIYEHRLHLPRVDCEMESYGITARGDHTEATLSAYEQHVAEAQATMCAIAADYGHDLQLAKGAALNDNMRDFFYGARWQECPRCGYRKRLKHWNGEYVGPNDACPKCLKPRRGRAGMRHVLVAGARPNLGLPVIESGKTGNATLDGDAMRTYATTLEEGPALDFVELLADSRIYLTAIGYMESYRRFWVPVPGAPGYFRIHASFNPCGTDHLRQSSNSPNMQNVAGESKELSNRACFGPLPDREWWNMDFKSIERRIPPYECGEPKMIAVFEQPDAPPYWGSLYYLTASVLYPEEFWPRSEERDRFKKECPRLYKQAKFFDLAKQYGAGRRKGDLLSRVQDSYDLVDNEFPRLAELQARYLRAAERTGWVETLPDRTVDPDRGYPILASRTDDGRVLSTTPFNYHTSGTACWAKNTALVRCADQCARWRAEGFDAHIPLEVHDSILFDFPRGPALWANRDRALVLKALMEESGPNLVPPIPTPVSVELHTESWAEGIPLC